MRCEIKSRENCIGNENYYLKIYKTIHFRITFQILVNEEKTNRNICFVEQVLLRPFP